MPPKPMLGSLSTAYIQSYYDDAGRCWYCGETPASRPSHIREHVTAARKQDTQAYVSWNGSVGTALDPMRTSTRDEVLE